MKHLITAALDWFIPAALREKGHSEELDRARTLVGVLAVVLVSIIIHLPLLPLSEFLQFYINRAMAVNLALSFASIALALVLFKYRGNFIVSGNLFALTAHLATLAAAFHLPENVVTQALILTLATPVLIAQIANYLSGVVWIVIVAVTPIAITQLGLHTFDRSWLTSWLLVLAGLFFANYIAHHYRVNMAARLKTERAQFEYAASHDALTGLANRVSFNQKFKLCIDDCKYRNENSVLVYLDLNQFKPVNDTHGHQVGDQVLITIGKRITERVRRSDTVARLGGDEFAILFEHCTLKDIDQLIQRIKTDVGKPIRAGDREVKISCSMGIVSCPQDGVEPMALYSLADRRMYEAKGADITEPFPT